MTLLELIKARITQHGRRALQPFQPSTWSAVAVLAIIAGTGVYVHYNPPYIIAELPTDTFADQALIMVSGARPKPTDAQGLAAFQNLWDSIITLSRINPDSPEAAPALVTMTAHATVFAELRPDDKTRRLADVARQRAKAAGVSPQELADRIAALSTRED